MDIMTLLGVLSQSVDQTAIKRLGQIATAMITMSGRVTMLGLSRWTEAGGSYRTIQRFYNSTIPWGMAMWLFFRAHLYQTGDDYLLVGDESVIGKAGKKTHGLDRFFSSIFGKPVAGLAFFALSLVNVAERKSYPLQVEQVIRTEAEKQATKDKKAKKQAKKRKSSTKKNKVGRPKGSRNKNKRQIEWTAELQRVSRMALSLLEQAGNLCAIRYFVLDGHFGNNNVLQMVRQSLKLHLVCKLRHDAALYFRYEGLQKPKGRKRIYGSKIDYDRIPDQHLVDSSTDKDIRTDTYHATMLHKSFSDPLNVVIIFKTNLISGKKAHLVLFSSDLSLAFDKLIDYYQLRFQIEFNFRDAKQFWGFDDFMNINPLPVSNAVGLSFFMVNFSQALLAPFRRLQPAFGILDLKAHFRARRYAWETLKLLPDTVDPSFIDLALHNVQPLGSIHPCPSISIPGQGV